MTDETQTSGCRLLPDEYFEEDETVAHETVFNDLKSSLEEALAWERGEVALRVTEFVDGERLMPTMLTGPELAARQQAREAQTPKPANDSAASASDYDSERDALHLRLSDTPAANVEETGTGVRLHYDANGNLVEVEMREASRRIRRFPSPQSPAPPLPEAISAWPQKKQE